MSTIVIVLYNNTIRHMTTYKYVVEFLFIENINQGFNISSS